MNRYLRVDPLPVGWAETLVIWDAFPRWGVPGSCQNWISINGLF
jgi:hypothetical protein